MLKVTEINLGNKETRELKKSPIFVDFSCPVEDIFSPAVDIEPLKLT